MLFVPEEGYWKLGLSVTGFHISCDTAAVIIKLSIPVSFSLRTGNEDEKMRGHFIWLPKNMAVVIVPRSFLV